MTTLMEEEPYVAAVKNDYIRYTCAKCFAWNVPGIPINGKQRLKRCSGCHMFSYCNEKCLKEDWKDHKSECLYFRLKKEIPSLVTRLLARAVRKLRAEPDFRAFNGRTFQALLGVSSQQKQHKKNVNAISAIHLEMKTFMGREAPDVLEVSSLYSKYLNNAFMVFDDSPLCVPRGEAFYIGMSGIKHSCCPNAFVVNSGAKLRLRTAQKDCTYNDETTLNYMGNRFFGCTEMRNRFLEGRLGECNCEKCGNVESDNIGTYGRADCCHDGWFSLYFHRCSNCGKEIDSENFEQAVLAMDILREEIEDYQKGYYTQDKKFFVSRWITMFLGFRRDLPDHNTYLMEIADMIYNQMMFHNAPKALAFAEFCVHHSRNRPFCLYHANLLCKRLLLCKAADKSLQEIKSALDEAIETVDVVYGEDHELTKTLKRKKADLDCGFTLGDFERLHL